jgi:hypothetical protein
MLTAIHELRKLENFEPLLLAGDRAMIWLFIR